MLARLGAKITQLVGVPEDTSWSQVQVSSPHDPAELAAGGALISVLCLPANHGAAEEGNDKLQALVEDFQKNLNSNRLEWLKNTLAEFEQKNPANERLLLLLIVPHEDKRVLYAAGCGPVKVAIERRGRKQVIFDDKASGKVVSGWVSHSDLVIAGTSEFVDQIWQDLKGPLEDRLEAAQAAIGGNEQQSLMAGVVLELGEPKLEEKKIEELPSPARVMSIGQNPMQESVPLPLPSRGLPDLRQRLLGGKALSWLSGENARPSRRASLIIGAVFLILLVTSIALGSVRKEKLRQENEYQSFVQPLEHSLEEAVSLKSVNPIRARSLVADARTQAEAVGDKFNNDKFGDRWKAFQDRLNQVWTEVSGEGQTAGKLWLDLTVIRDYLSGNDLILVDDKRLGVIDRSYGSAVMINLSDKNAKVVGGGEVIKKTIDADVWRGNLITLSESGVSRFGDPAPASASLLDADSEIWAQTKHIAGFAGNLYLAGGVDIWRYPGAEGEIAKRQRWLKPGVEPDLANMVDWAISGEIWALKGDGRILRFNQGQSVAFEVKGLVKPWSKPVRLAVNDETKELVILDKEQKSLVFVSQETGEYKRQLIWDRLADVADLAFDPEGKRLFVLLGHELYELPL